jgi:cyclopropane fatty-acyl-phospholipid synthase-like methyltransferase
MSGASSYRNFSYPLNVFMHILSREEATVRYLHYGLFESGDEPIAEAQERSTEMLLERLPPPPARLLDVGVGLATTLARLTRSGHDAEGITPDEHQIATIRERYGDELRVSCAKFESFDGRPPYEAVFFQESSQYIDSNALFAAASAITGHIVVIDEFASRPLGTPGALHDLGTFLAAAEQHGFARTEEIDLSRHAAPTIDYVASRIAQYRDDLIAGLGLSLAQIDSLVESGDLYREMYRTGAYVYRLLQFRR